jgi:hypothetical protein
LALSRRATAAGVLRGALDLTVVAATFFGMVSRSVTAVVYAFCPPIATYQQP